MAKLPTINKGKFWITVNEQNDVEAFYPDSSAEQIAVESAKLTSKNVLAALNEIVDKINGLDTGVTGVKGDAETTYRKGNVNLTPANIGAEPAFTKNTAFNKNFGTAAGTVMEGNDSRVTSAVSDIAAIKQKNTEQDAEIAKKINSSEKGTANGVATLDAQGLVPSSQLPSYVDDVVEFDSKSDFPTTGEDGKIYIAKDTNLQYRWSGTAYVEISPSLALGETAQTAYPGNKGKQNADDIANIKSGTIEVGVAKKIKNHLGFGTWNGLFTEEGYYDGSLQYSFGFDSSQFYVSGSQKSVSVSLSNSGVTAGTYQGLTIDSTGRITAAKDMNYATTDVVTSAMTALTNSLAPQADGKLSKKFYVYPDGSVASGTVYDASKDMYLSIGNGLTLETIDKTNNIWNIVLSTTGVNEGTYSAVTVNEQGRVTGGYQSLAVINEGDAIPSNLVIGGLIIEKRKQA